MRKTGLLAAAAALALVAAPASAAIVFDLDNVNLVDGGTLTGSFTVSDDLATLVDFSITSSDDSGWPYGTYVGRTYTLADATSSSWNAAQGLHAMFESPEAQLSIFFNQPLTTTGATSLAITSNETQIIAGSGTRYAISGEVSPQLADPGGVVPEPAAWALMIAGFGLVGASLRRRERLSVKLS